MWVISWGLRPWLSWVGGHVGCKAPAWHVPLFASATWQRGVELAHLPAYDVTTQTATSGLSSPGEVGC